MTICLTSAYAINLSITVLQFSYKVLTLAIKRYGKSKNCILLFLINKKIVLNKYTYRRAFLKS